MQRPNWLLAGLEPTVREQLSPALRPVELERGRTLQAEGEPVEHVYFPEGAVVGLFSNLPEGQLILTAMAGWDGALGVFEACGSRRACYEAQVQVAGRAWRLRTEDYQRAFERSPALRERVHKYIEMLLTEARQSAACNAVHPVEARVARLILEAIDRGEPRERLEMTQAELSGVVGVQRTTVTGAMNQLQSLGALRVRRGAVEIADRHELERRACCCWRMLAEARGAILGSDAPVCDPAA
jgi:CRP-like cAMP-binding protein